MMNKHLKIIIIVILALFGIGGVYALTQVKNANRQAEVSTDSETRGLSRGIPQLYLSQIPDELITEPKLSLAVQSKLNASAPTTEALLELALTDVIDVWTDNDFANNSANWDTAYGWGDHSSLYLALTNTTPFTPDADYEPATKKYVDDNAGGATTEAALEATLTDVTNVYTNNDFTENSANWDTAFSWGDHSSASFADFSDTPSRFTTANAIYTTNATPDAVVESTVILTEGPNSFDIAKGTASLNIGQGATLNIDTSLTVNTTSVALNQNLRTTDDVTFNILSLANPLYINQGGTGQTTQQAAIDALTNVSAASATQVLTKDGSGNATFQDVAGVSDHGALTGLTDDDHSIYPLILGRAGGQNLYGGTGFSENLALRSNSSLVKGKITFGTSAYDEAENRLGIKTSIPLSDIDDLQSLPSASRGITARGMGDTTNAPLFILKKARGGPNPSTVIDTDYLGELQASGYDGSSYIEPAYIRFLVDGAVSTGNIPTSIAIGTGTTDGGTEAIRIDEVGKVGFGTDAPTGRVTLADSSSIPPLSLTERSAEPSAPAAGDIYLDDGTNCGDTSPCWRRYTGAAWEDIGDGGGGGSSDHGALTGLTDDDHTIYPLLLGRSGGQTLIGGTDASDDLTLQSSSDATKGKIYLGADGEIEADSNGFILGTNTSDGADNKYSRILGGGVPSGSGRLRGANILLYGNEAATYQGDIYIGLGDASGAQLDFLTGANVTSGRLNSDGDWLKMKSLHLSTLDTVAERTLQVTDASAPQFRLAHTDDSKFADFQVDTNHDLTITPSSTGQVILKPTTDSADFLQVMDADGGTPVLNVDSTNERVGIGTTGPDRALDVLDASNPQLRLTQADGSVFTDFQTDSAGDLFIQNTGGQIFIGQDSGGTSQTTPTENTGIGALTFSALTDGSYNVAVGRGSLYSLTEGHDNVAVGWSALLDLTTGTRNTAIGYQAGANLTTGGRNIIIGRGALNTATADSHNVAIGDTALFDSNGGTYNIAIGRETLQNLTTGDYSIGIGSSTGGNITTGGNNILLGYNTGQGIITGGQNTIIGGNIGGLDSGLANTILIGAGNSGQRLKSSSDGHFRIIETAASKFLDITVDTNHDATFTPSSTGQIILQPTTDSTDFFQVMDADGGTSVLNVDSVNERVGIGTDTPSHLLHIYKTTPVSAEHFILVESASEPLFAVDYTGDLYVDDRIQFDTNGTINNIAVNSKLLLTGGASSTSGAHLWLYGEQNTGVTQQGNFVLRGDYALATDSEPDISYIIGAFARPSAVTNLDGGNVGIRGGNGASDSSGDADGGHILIDGGVGYGTGDDGDVLLQTVQSGKVGIGTATTVGLLTLGDSASLPPLNMTERSAAPSAPSTGDMYVDDGTGCTDTKPCWKRYNGAAWEEFGDGGGAGSISIGTAIGSSTAGSVLFVDGSGQLGQDNANFFWDDTEDRLGLGTATPNEQLELTGNLRMPATTATTGIIYRDGDRFIHNFQHPTGDSAVPTGRNTFVGEFAGSLSLGSGATSTTHGSNNVGVGSNVLKFATTGYQNVAVGSMSMYPSESAYNNAGLGYKTFYANISGYKNTAVGSEALSDLINGDRNIAIGFDAGAGITTGNDNVIIGGMTGLASDLEDTIIIGTGDGVQRWQSTGVGHFQIIETAGSKYVDLTVDTNHDLTIKPSSTGQVILKPTTDSTDFFQVLDADGGAPVLNVDVVNERVGIGTATPVGLLTIADSGVTAPLNLTERASAPSSPASGDIYLDDGTGCSDTKPCFKRYTGAAWEEIGDGGGGGGGSSRWTAESGALVDQDTNTMRITTTDACDTNYATGTPVRYSDDQSTYYYGIVTGCTDNGSTLDVDLDGYALGSGNDGYFEYGIPEVLTTFELIGVGNCSVSDTWFPKRLWGGPDAIIVRTYIYFDEDPTGQAATGNVEINGNNAFSSELSITATENSTDSGVTVSTTEANRTVEQDDFIEIDWGQCGSGDLGGNAAWALLYFVTP